MEKHKKTPGSILLSAGSVLFFVGIYVMPEQIKIFSMLYTVLLFFFFVIFSKGKVHLYLTNVMWIAFAVEGIFSTLIGNVGSISESIEFCISLMIGILASSMHMDYAMKRSQLKAFQIIVGVALLGCFLQLIVPTVLLRITSITLGAEKFILHRDFASWGRIVGFSYQTGVTSHYLCMMELLIICSYITSVQPRASKRVLHIVLFIVGLVFILMTEKRSTLLALFVILIVLMYVFNRKHVLKLIGVGCIIAIMFLVVVTQTELGQKMILRSVGSNPLTGRVNIYEVLWNMFLRNPIFGQGFGSTLHEVTDFTNGHNIYLQVLAENGLVGFTLLLLILGSNIVKAMKVLMQTIKNKRSAMTEAFCVGYQIYFIIVGLIGNPLYDIYPLVTYMITAGMVQSGKIERRRR